MLLVLECSSCGRRVAPDYLWWHRVSEHADMPIWKVAAALETELKPRLRCSSCGSREIKVSESLPAGVRDPTPEELKRKETWDNVLPTPDVCNACGRMGGLCICG